MWVAPSRVLPVPSLCPSVGLSVPYRLVTRKQKKHRKIQIGINVLEGTNGWSANFQLKRSKHKVTVRQKPSQPSSHHRRSNTVSARWATVKVMNEINDDEMMINYNTRVSPKLTFYWLLPELRSSTTLCRPTSTCCKYNVCVTIFEQPGTRSQQPFTAHLHHIPASAVVMKLNYSAEPMASAYHSTFVIEGKGKGPVLDIALLHDEHMLRSALQSRKWQLIGVS